MFTKKIFRFKKKYFFAFKNCKFLKTFNPLWWLSTFISLNLLWRIFAKNFPGTVFCLHFSFCSFMFYRGGMLNIFKSLENIVRHGTSTLAVVKILNVNIFFLQFFEKIKPLLARKIMSCFYVKTSCQNQQILVFSGQNINFLCNFPQVFSLRKI